MYEETPAEHYYDYAVDAEMCETGCTEEQALEHLGWLESDRLNEYLLWAETTAWGSVSLGGAQRADF